MLGRVGRIANGSIVTWRTTGAHARELSGEVIAFVPAYSDWARYVMPYNYADARTHTKVARKSNSDRYVVLIRNGEKRELRFPRAKTIEKTAKVEEPRRKRKEREKEVV